MLYPPTNKFNFNRIYCGLGTPGVGKSKLCEELIRNGLDMEWIEIGQVAKQFDCFSGYDEELECHILNEDKVCINCLLLLFLKM